jgi:hypothetical protein
MQVSGKTAFITGGAQGLGEAYATALLARGAKVCRSRMSSYGPSYGLYYYFKVCYLACNTLWLSLCLSVAVYFRLLLHLVAQALKLYSRLLGEMSKSNILLYYTTVYVNSQVHIRHMHNTITTI